MILFVILTVILFVTGIIFKYTILFKKSENFNGPKPLPIVGNMLLFLKKRPNEVLDILCSFPKKYGKFVPVWILTELHMLCTDPKITETILSSSKVIDKSVQYYFLKEWLGDGLLLSSGKKWFTHRKIITPTFHFKILQEFVEVFQKRSEVFVNKLKYECEKQSVIDIYAMTALFTLDVICETAMGTSINAQSGKNTEYVQAVKDIAEVIHYRMYDILLRNKYLFPFSKTYQVQKKALKILHEFTDKVIIQRRNELISKTEQNNSEEDGIGLKRKMAFLDVLLQSKIDGKPLTNMDIREEVDTFMFEGHDTTTSGIAFGLFNIAKYPDIQKKLYDEMVTVLGDDPLKPVTISDLNNLHYLDLFIKENLRLYPSVPMIGRKILKDTEINGKIVPADSNIIIFVYCMNRNPEIFPEPEKFRPERFDVENSTEKLNPYAYVPFSAGPRNCIGQKFALLEMKCILSKLVRSFEFKLPDGANPEPELKAPLILRACDSLMVNIKPRK